MGITVSVLRELCQSCKSFIRLPLLESGKKYSLRVVFSARFPLSVVDALIDRVNETGPFRKLFKEHDL